MSHLDEGCYSVLSRMEKRENHRRRERLNTVTLQYPVMPPLCLAKPGTDHSDCMQEDQEQTRPAV